MDGQPLAAGLRILARLIEVLSLVAILMPIAAVAWVGPQVGLTLLAPIGVMQIVVVGAYSAGRIRIRAMTLIGVIEIGLGVFLVLSLPNVGGPCCVAPEPWAGTTPALIVTVVGVLHVAACCAEELGIRAARRARPSPGEG